MSGEIREEGVKRDSHDPIRGNIFESREEHSMIAVSKDVSSLFSPTITDNRSFIL